MKLGEVDVSLLISLGIDPGMASMGLAVVCRSAEGVDKVLDGKVIETKKATKKELRNLRMCVDDQRRMRLLSDASEELIKKYNPHVIGIEAYAPTIGRMGGNAWKVGNVMQAMVCLSWNYGYEPLIFLASDLKRTFLGKSSGSKLEVEEVLREKVLGVGDILARFPKTKQEHVTDAIGHAVLALTELEKMRRMAGFF